MGIARQLSLHAIICLSLYWNEAKCSRIVLIVLLNYWSLPISNSVTSERDTMRKRAEKYVSASEREKYGGWRELREEIGETLGGKGKWQTDRETKRK